MRASILSLFDSVVDYAGTFPPAGLKVPASVDEYLRHQRSPENWILGRYASASSDLVELVSVIDSLKGDIEMPVTVIGQPTSTVSEWKEALENDSLAMNAFIKAADSRVWIEAYEIRLPSNSKVETCLKDLGAFEEVDVFVELPWEEGMEDAAAAIAQTEWLAAKARTGGDDPSNHPSATTLAKFIHSQVGLDLSFKLTAGIHHLLPKVNREDGVASHGLLNVLAATAFAYTHDLASTEIEQILLTASVEDWQFEEKSLTWRNLSLGIEDIEDSRDLLWSIGSCSIQEVLGGLQQLKMLTGGN